MIQTKQCSTCGQIKPLSEFSKRTGSSDGHQYRCRTCQAAYFGAWYQQNRDRALAKTQRWRQANPGKAAAASRRHRATHADHHKVYMREYMRQYYANNPEQRQKQKARDRTRYHSKRIQT